MEQATLCRHMASKWLEISEEVRNPALKKCYVEKALRYRALAAIYEHHKEPAQPLCERS
jgi:hypothetical protein